jgi:AAA+ ATPase superfamily predicted ATPase
MIISCNPRYRTIDVVSFVTTFLGATALFLFVTGFVYSVLIGAVFALFVSMYAGLSTRRRDVTVNYLTRNQALSELVKKDQSYKTSLIGRDSVLEELRQMLADGITRTVIISGPPGIGKTRTAYAATETQKVETLVYQTKDAEDNSPRALLLGTLTDSLRLSSTKKSRVRVIVILEDPSHTTAQSFIEKSLDVDNIKLVITSSSARNTEEYTNEPDDRIKRLELEPLSAPEAEALLETAGAHIDDNLRSWIMDESEGNPKALLIAAKYGDDVRGDPFSFIEAAYNFYEDALKISFKFQESVIQILSLLSLLKLVGIKEPVDKDLRLLCKIFGDGLQPHSVRANLDLLSRNGLVKHIDPLIVSVYPGICATGLAKKEVLDRGEDLAALFDASDKSGKKRLLERLQLVKADEVENLFNKLFSQDNELDNFSSALSNSYMLRVVAGSIPERIASLISKGLQSMTTDERATTIQESGAKYNLIFTLNDLLLRLTTSTYAAYSLFLIAETERERWDLHATNALSDYFSPYNRLVPAPLADRSRMLKDLISEQRSIALRLTVVRVIAKVMQEGLLRPSPAFLISNYGLPFDAAAFPNVTTEEIESYVQELVAILKETARDSDLDLANEVLRTLPSALVALSALGGINLESAKTQLKTCVDCADQDILPISVLRVYNALQSVIARLSEAIEKQDAGGHATLAQNLEQLQNLSNRLDAGNFFTRLRLWADGYDRRDYELANGDLSQVYVKLNLLTQEAINDPNLVNARVIDWLCSAEAEKSALFFSLLGKNDRTHLFVNVVEAIGQRPEAVNDFASYFEGLNENDESFTFKLLNDLSQSDKILPEAILAAQMLINGRDTSKLKQIAILAKKSQLKAYDVGRTLSSPTLKTPLSESQYCDILTSIDDTTSENAITIIEMINAWVDRRKSITGKLLDLAWKCLDLAPRIRETPEEYFSFNRLASLLAKDDFERGLRLLGLLLRTPYEKRTINPISRFLGHQFLDTLLSINRTKTLESVTSLFSEIETQGETINGGFIDLDNVDVRDFIDQKKDLDILVSVASQGTDQAKLVAKWLSISKPGFFNVAYSILEIYPYDIDVPAALALHPLEEEGFPAEKDLQSCLNAVKQRKEDASTPSHVKPWLTQVETQVQFMIKRERHFDSITKIR